MKFYPKGARDKTLFCKNRNRNKTRVRVTATRIGRMHSKISKKNRIYVKFLGYF
jgi:hypothetical protein